MTNLSLDPNSLAQQLDDLIPAGGTGGPRESADPLVAVAARLARVPQPQMTPEALMRIKIEVMDAQQTRAARRSRRRLPVGQWAVAASLILVLLVFGLASPVLASVPGDWLYPVKQVVEWGELTAAQSSETRAFTHLLHAERRLQEALTLLDHGQIAPDLLDSALTQIQSAAQTARSGAELSPAAVTQLQTKTAEVSRLLDSTLQRALQAPIAPEGALLALELRARDLQDAGDLLLPAVTLTNTPTVTPSHTPTRTLTPSVTVRPAVTRTPPLPAGPANPPNGGASPAVPEWNENADCGNPPPEGVPALGWRARCEGGSAPQDAAGTQGPPPHANAGGNDHQGQGGPPENPSPPDHANLGASGASPNAGRPADPGSASENRPNR